jgi:hypothetical protein
VEPVQSFPREEASTLIARANMIVTIDVSFNILESAKRSQIVTESVVKKILCARVLSCASSQ